MRPLVHVRVDLLIASATPPRPYPTFSITHKPVYNPESQLQRPIDVHPSSGESETTISAMAQTTTTTTAIAVPHPPAMKVGGRRLSVSAKPKSQQHAGTVNAEPSKEDTTVDDYPRPAPPTNEAPLHHNHQHNNDEEVPPPKKEKIDKKMQELAHKKAEITRPTRDLNAGNKGHAMGIRISQPAGKGLGL